MNMHFSGYLAYTLHPLQHLYFKYMQEWGGEFFPYLWMYEVAKEIAEILRVFDHQLDQGSDGAKNLIGVGFVESLPIPNEGGGDLVAGHPNLMKQYRLVFGD